MSTSSSDNAGLPAQEGVLGKIWRETSRPFRRWTHHRRMASTAAKRQARLARRRDGQAPVHSPPAGSVSPAVSSTRLDTMQYCHDFTQKEIEIIQAVSPYTMTSPERIWAVINAVRHVVRSGVPGEIVECGVWKGGSMMAAVLTLLQLNDVERAIHLYDTFDGMPPPAEIDCDFAGRAAAEQMRVADRETSNIWCLARLEDVKRNLFSTGYPAERLRFIPGRVENTIPFQAPERIALLRLDTDWYESTRHELEHLYPRLSPSGVLIIDDYGYWQGARRATDEYFDSLDNPPLLSRIDSTGRLAVKPA
jgi:O-methyltransferase